MHRCTREWRDIYRGNRGTAGHLISGTVGRYGKYGVVAEDEATTFTLRSGKFPAPTKILERCRSSWGEPERDVQTSHAGRHA